MSIGFGLRESWLWRIHRKLVRASSEGAGTFVTVALGLPSIALAMVFGVTSISGGSIDPSRAIVQVPPLDHTTWIIAGSVLTVVSLYTAGAVALYSLDPKAYARAIILGATPSQIFLALAERAAALLKHFSRGTTEARSIVSDLKKFFRDDDTAFVNSVYEKLSSGEIDQSTARARRIVKKTSEIAERHLVKKHRSLKRIFAMKQIAAEELGIPIRRFCDLVLEYSPQIHETAVRKYARNWEEIRELAERRDPRLADRLKGLITQTSEIIDDAVRREGRVELLIKFRDLHRIVHDLASERSTSGTLQLYAAGLKKLAKIEGNVLLAKLAQAPSSQREEGDLYNLKREIHQRFHFLYRKQRAHPGCDPHELLKRLLDQWKTLPRTGLDEAAAETLLPFLQKIASPWREEPFNDYDRDALSRALRSLETLPTCVDLVLDAARKEITNKFLNTLRQWATGQTGKRFLVTHGYSKTVKHVLTKTIEKEARRSPFDAVFLLVTDDEQIMDTRLMEYDLKRRRRNFGVPDDTTEVSVRGQDSEGALIGNLMSATLDTIEGLLSRGDQVIVMLGAECFDEKGNVMRLRGMGSLLPKLSKRIKKRGATCKVAVVAEAYKCFGSLVAEKPVYQGHLENLDVYSPNRIDAIISDKVDEHSYSKSQI